MPHPDKKGFSPHDIVFSKLREDLGLSAIHDYERIRSAIKNCRNQTQFLIEHSGRKLEDWGGADHLPESPRVDEKTLTSEQSRKEMASRVSNLIEHAGRHRLRISCECIEVGPLAALLSMRNRFYLDLDIGYTDTSGRKQVARLNESDEFDFVITANAPLYLLGADQALRYRSSFPIHSENSFFWPRNPSKRGE